jgi:hypothetical protein
MSPREKETPDAFGSWLERAGEALKEILGNLFSPPLGEGDRVQIKTRTGEAVSGEVLENSAAGVLVAEDNVTSRETFVATASIDVMEIVHQTDDDPEEEDEPRTNPKITIREIPPAILAEEEDEPAPAVAAAAPPSGPSDPDDPTPEAEGA